MNKFAFISRHEPTESQKMLAEKAGIELVGVGDRDGFTLDSKEFREFQGVVVVHAQAALRALQFGMVGVFNNINRAPLGEKPRFETTSFVVTNMYTRDPGCYLPEGATEGLNIEETVYLL